MKEKIAEIIQICKKDNGHVLYIHVGNQTFQLAYKGSYIEEAEWYKSMLVKALSKFLEGWKSGEEVEEIEAEAMIMMSKAGRRDYQKLKEKLLDPEAQIKEVCPDCGGSKIKGNPILDDDGDIDFDLEPCPTCIDGKVWAWVKCKTCNGHARLPVTFPSKCLPPDHDRDCDDCQDGLIPLTIEMALERAGQEYEVIKKGVKG
jgi:hypothetical protein